MGVDAAQPGEPALGAAVCAQIGDDDFFVVTDDGKANIALAVADDAYLTPDLQGELGEIAG
ncbi:MAG: hypothetical protein MUP30_03070 [Deltaproteobacteria bacterium]|nr:hypothetical protein [Deltaproteobacteria bacterium]